MKNDADKSTKFSKSWDIEVTNILEIDYTDDGGLTFRTVGKSLIVCLTPIN